ncbi:MAG TPA: single-stranded-DNA-specific exonuclease RecJ [Pseudogracilibacillus sp.]|nr:single-stranded-DNA-specific exonuclease RecJ [Pseudogracilibacillus sp.]
MLKSKANWQLKENSSFEQDETSLIDILLADKGITSVEEKEQFLHPTLQTVTNPKQLANIEKASDRIIEAIADGESILIYGDYDADGITSTALLMQVFMELGADCDFYIPNRFKEGYGLQHNAIEQFKHQGISLIITVDNGISNVEEVAFAQSLGIDVIITDHHEIQEELPNAYTILHPKLSDAYEFKGLAGVGVAFQLARFLLEETPDALLELAAIGTIADMVPLKKDNRAIVALGLQALNKTTNPGVLALKEVSGIESVAILTERDIGFKIAPRLNSVGRMDNASRAVELLLTLDTEEALHIAADVEQLNQHRKTVVEEIVAEASVRVNPEDGIIMLYDSSWHEGVLGIAASRLVRQFHRPVILLTHKPDTGILKGSGRSIPAFHLFETGMQFHHLFSQFGGHAQAAGMTFPLENFAELKTRFNDAILNQLSENDFYPVISDIHVVSSHQLTERFVEQLSQLAPFGMANEEPVFLVQSKASQVRQIGQEKNHLKVQFKEEGRVFDAIGFQLGHLYPFISNDAILSVVGKLQINEWNGTRTVQMLLEDMAIEDWQLFDNRGKSIKRSAEPYLQAVENAVLIGQSQEQEILKQVKENREHIDLITYSNKDITVRETDLLIICDLPSRIEDLQFILSHIHANKILVNYHVTDDAFFNTVPTRDEFKWMYSFLINHQPVKLKVDLVTIIKEKQWSKEKAIFMVKVFLDLKFFYVEENVLYVNKAAEKTPLHHSITYQHRLQQGKIEKILYYSSYDDLKEWINEYRRNEMEQREEVTNES